MLTFNIYICAYTYTIVLLHFLKAFLTPSRFSYKTKKC